MPSIIKFHNLPEEELKKILAKTYEGQKWAEVFLTDSHHGISHGFKVKDAANKLIAKLTPEEKNKFLDEGKQINPDNPLEAATACVEFSAFFHDCGRFNDQGEIVVQEQKKHHTLGAERAKYFCLKNKLDKSIYYIKDAVLGHDFQSTEITPHLEPPKTIIGQIVQSADQMGWFHPKSLQRTIDYNKAINIPFFDPDLPLETRLSWKPQSTSYDMITTMLYQLFGVRDEKRFAITAAREKIASYLPELEKGIITLAEQNNVKIEVEELIKEYKEYDRSN